jgi:hypothetical protein
VLRTSGRVVLDCRKKGSDCATRKCSGCTASSRSWRFCLSYRVALRRMRSLYIRVLFCLSCMFLHATACASYLSNLLPIFSHLFVTHPQRSLLGARPFPAFTRSAFLTRPRHSLVQHSLPCRSSAFARPAFTHLVWPRRSLLQLSLGSPVLDPRRRLISGCPFPAFARPSSGVL